MVLLIMTKKPDNILLIVVDSLRYDRLSCYNYNSTTSPFLDSFAKDGIKFEKAYAPAPWTVPVHGSLFTGLLPSYHGSHRKMKTFKQPAEATLAGILSNAGYQTVGFSANPWISPEFNFNTGFDDFEFLAPDSLFPGEEIAPEDVSDQWSVQKVKEIITWANEGNLIKRLGNGMWEKFIRKEFADAEDLNRAILDWFSQSNDSKTFLFANYMDVHDPHYDTLFDYNIFPKLTDTWQTETTSFQTPHKAMSKKIGFQSEPEDPKRARELYDHSIKYVDKKLRELFTGLDQRIDLDNTLTIILGDHGECMGEHGYWGHGTYLHNELLRVPLLIQTPEDSDMRPLEYNRPTSLLDLPLYISDTARTTIDAGQKIETNSFYSDTPLFAECTGPRPDMEGRASQNGYRAVINNGWVYIRNRDTDETELRKSGEDSQQEASTEDVECQLRNLEQERWKKPQYQQVEEKTRMTQETEHRLKDLGYL